MRPIKSNHKQTKICKIRINIQLTNTLDTHLNIDTQTLVKMKNQQNYYITKKKIKKTLHLKKKKTNMYYFISENKNNKVIHKRIEINLDEIK